MSEIFRKISILFMYNLLPDWFHECWLFLFYYISNASNLLIEKYCSLNELFQWLTIDVNIWVTLKPPFSYPNLGKEKTFYYLTWMSGGDLYTE